MTGSKTEKPAKSDEKKAGRTRALSSHAKSKPFIVGVGASAGGLEALERFFSSLPITTGMAFVVIQHLSPDHKSMMVDLLAKRTSMVVTQAEHGLTVAADTIYVIPPGKLITIDHGILYLSAKSTTSGVTLPIDIFLTSLAKDQGARAIGIILSGTGSDGTRGLRAIHEQGGMVVVQDPLTARFDGMPRSAIESGIVDDVMMPERIFERLLSYVRQANSALDFPSLEAEADTPAGGLSRILSILNSQTGTDFAHYKKTTLIRRIERRMHLNQVASHEDYATLLTANRQEAENLKRELLISVTNFFRDTDAFADLNRQAIVALVAKTAENGNIRAWICGCATGEEAYSVAILFSEEMERVGKSLEIKIFATDIDRNALEVAGGGTYPESVVSDVDEQRRNKYFSKNNSTYKIKPDIRRMVVFAPHNVIKDPPFTKLDLVCCRNLLIYFESNLQQAVLSRFQFALKQGGMLFLGSSETLGPQAADFEPINAKHRLYRLLHGRSLPITELRTDSARGSELQRAYPQPTIDQARREELRAVEEGTRQLLTGYCPPSLLIDEKQEIIHNYGGVERYLRIPAGEATLDVCRHLPSSIGTLVAATLHRVFREWKEISIQQADLDRDQQQASEHRDIVQIRFKPLTLPKGGQRYVMMHFVSVPKFSDNLQTTAIDVSVETEERIKLLESELQSSRENQQAVIEELETTNEELQATNEELLASNEELQSTNEELQSVNEELYTVNAELKEKVDELTNLNNDLDNFMRTTQIGTIFIDANGTLRRFTPASTEFVNLMDRDIGRPFSDISTNIDYPNFDEDIAHVIKAGAEIERHVMSPSGKATHVRVLPYSTETGAIGGAVVTFVDTTDLTRSRQRLQSYIDSLPHHIAALDKNGAIVAVNAAWKRFGDECGLAKDYDWAGRIYLESCVSAGGPMVTDYSDGARAVGGLRSVLDRKENFFSLEYINRATGRKRWFQMNVSPLLPDEGGVIVTHNEITHRVLSEARLKLSGKIIENSSEAIVITDPEERILYVNNAFTNITGYSEEEVTGKTPRLLSSGRHDKHFYAKMWTALLAQGRWAGEVWNRKKSGEVYPELVSINAIKDDRGAVINYVSFFSDITSLKQTERLLRQKNADLQQFAHVASHDLQEPLRMVVSFLQLLKKRHDGDLSSEAQEYISFAVDGALRMNNLVRDLLEFSRVDSKAELNKPVEIAKVLANALKNLDVSIQESKANITLPTELPCLPGDENLLCSLLQNLIGNALKYRDPNRVPEIRLEVSEGQGLYKFSVIDNGIGIKPDYFDKIFMIFQRLHTREEYPGTGIGLALCRRIVERHGGVIWVESKPGSGSTFHFTLPAQPFSLAS
ncbi:MAG: PAS domain S-box protein [Alphaproteobacteria bacterium]|nr:PAS domain S-box protein [Alphaproteobacteria bacterium]